MMLVASTKKAKKNRSADHAGNDVDSQVNQQPLPTVVGPARLIPQAFGIHQIWWSRWARVVRMLEKLDLVGDWGSRRISSVVSDKERGLEGSGEEQT